MRNPLNTVLMNDTLSFNEALSKKENLMPPPPTPLLPLLNFPKIDMISYLRKNLVVTPLNIKQNRSLKEELDKIMKMNDNTTKNLNNEELSNNQINNKDIISDTYSNLVLKNEISLNENEEEQEINEKIKKKDNKTPLDSYNNSIIINNTNNLTTTNNNIIENNNNNLEKLKSNLCLKNINTGINDKLITNIKFIKLPKPHNKTEITIFNNNLLLQLNEFIEKEYKEEKLDEKEDKESNKDNKENTNECNYLESLYVKKFALQTRFNDYKNNGLKLSYYIDVLMKMQNDIADILVKYNKISKVEVKICNKKFNKFLGNKRKKAPRKQSLSEMKSVTDNSNSLDE